MAIDSPVTALTQQDLLDLLDRVFPQDYLASLRAGDGFEMLQAYAAMFTRLSLAISRAAADAFIDTASEGARASGDVELFRESAASINTPVDGQSGAAASVVSGAGVGEMRVTGLTNMQPSSVGRFLDLRGTASPENTETFEISQLNDGTSVDVINPAAIVPDGNNGTILWEEVSRTVVVKAGTVVTTGAGGLDFVTLQDQTFAPADLGPFQVPAEAVAPGYEYSVTGQRTAADGTVLEGEVDTVGVLVEEPPLADVTIQVRQVADMAGGIDEALAGLGRNRGIERGSDEDTPSFRERIRRLPDTVSPEAAQRVVDNLLRPFGLEFEIIETFEITYQTAYNAPATVIPGSTFNPNLFVYNDPDVDGVPFRNRWLDANDERGGLIVVVENSPPIRDTGMAYNDTAASVQALVNDRGGQRAVGAYDVPQDLGFGAVQGGYNGVDLRRHSLYKGLFDTLESIKPFEASVAVELRGE